MLKFLLFLTTDLLDIFELISLCFDSLLQVTHVDRSLGFLLLRAHLSLVDSAHVLVYVPLVEPLDLLHGIFSRIKLLAKFFHLKLPCLDKIVAVLTLLEQLNDSAT